MRVRLKKRWTFVIRILDRDLPILRLLEHCSAAPLLVRRLEAGPGAPFAIFGLNFRDATAALMSGLKLLLEYVIVIMREIHDTVELFTLVLQPHILDLLLD